MSQRSSNWMAGGQNMPVIGWAARIVSLVAVPLMAFLWWALAFLPWTRFRIPLRFASWPPSLPAVFTDLDVAVFGPLGASLVVVALLRRTELASMSILLGLGVSAWVTLSRGADIHGNVLNTSQRYVMLAVVAFSAFAGLAIGIAAITSLRALGFIGLLAVQPVVSLVALVFLSPDVDDRWLTRLALGALLVMIAWRVWSGVLLWPILFALFWLLNLFMAALRNGAETLRHPGVAGADTGGVLDAMADFVRSAWSVFLGTSWSIFWPAAVVAAVGIAARFVWRRFG